MSNINSVACVKKAKITRATENPVLLHTDRSVQYTLNDYYKALGNTIHTSYSRKDNPWDSAPIESFHALIKREWLCRYKFRTIRDVNDAYYLIIS